MTQLEQARLWTWAHRELGDEACEEILAVCDAQLVAIRDGQLVRTAGDDYRCVCGDILGALLVLP